MTQIPQSSLELWPVGNCQVTGLIDETGGLVWGCVPRVDGDPVFCALLNGDKQDEGVWRIELEDFASAHQEYQRNTSILKTRLEAKDGSAIEIVDFAPRFSRAGRMYRPVAFVRLDGGVEVDGDALADALRESLPGFMVPVAFHTWAGAEGLKPDRPALTREAERRAARSGE